MVKSGVDLTVGRVDGVGASRCGVGVGLTDQADEWPEEAHPKFDEEDAKFQSDGRQAVAAARANTLDEAFRAELAQIVPKLAETVLIAGEVMASDDEGVQLAGGPVANEAAGMQQRLQQTDHAVVMQLEAGDAALADQRWRSQCGKLASIDRTGQQLGLFGEAPLIGGGQPLAEQREVLQPTPNPEVVGVVRAGFSSQNAIAVLVATDVLLGE